LKALGEEMQARKEELVIELTQETESA